MFVVILREGASYDEVVHLCGIFNTEEEARRVIVRYSEHEYFNLNDFTIIRANPGEPMWYDVLCDRARTFPDTWIDN